MTAAAGPNSWMRIVVGKRIKIPRIFIKRADSRRERGRTKDGNQAPRAFPAGWKTDVAFGRVHIWRNRIPVAVAVGFAYCRTSPTSAAFIRRTRRERERERERDRLKRGSLGVQSANPSSWPPNSCTRVLAFTWKSRSGAGSSPVDYIPRIMTFRRSSWPLLRIQGILCTALCFPPGDPEELAGVSREISASLSSGHRRCPRISCENYRENFDLSPFCPFLFFLWFHFESFLIRRIG